MNIQGLFSQLNALSTSLRRLQPGQWGQGVQFGQGQGQAQRTAGSGQGFSTADTFAPGSSRNGRDLGTVLRCSLAGAGVDRTKARSVMDAVRQGTPLDQALKDAGVRPEQHHSVMTSVRAQDPASGPGGDQAGFGRVLLSSLAGAGVDQTKARSVMDAVRCGTPLDEALMNAGVSPEQHYSVMTSVRAQDPASKAGGTGGSGTAG